MTDDTQAAYPDPNADPTPPRRPPATGPVQYRGSDLEPERGPGLGCFRFQLAVLAIFIVLAPLSVGWGWPESISAALLFAVIVLLLVTGQTIIFLLRLVAADRRGRRRPLASETRTVGELEDAAARESPAPESPAPGAGTPEPPAPESPAPEFPAPGAGTPEPTPPGHPATGPGESSGPQGPVRQ